MNLAPIRLTIASMTAKLGQILFPIGFVSHFLATIGLRSPRHTAAIAHRHAACGAESTGTSGTVEFGRPQPSTRALISAYRNNVAYPFLDKYLVSVRMSSERLDASSTPNQTTTRLHTWRS